MKKKNILVVTVFSIICALFFVSCTQVHRDIKPILDEIGIGPDYYSMTVWSTEKGLVTKIQPKENFWSIDKWENISLKYTDQNGSYWEESHWAGNRNILELKEIDNWVDNAFYFTYPFVEKGKKYTLHFSLNYAYSSTIKITSDYDVLGEVDNGPFFESWNVVDNTAWRVYEDESKDNYVVYFNDCSFPNDTDFYKISDYKLGFRNGNWSDQSGTLYDFWWIKNYVDFKNKRYIFNRNTKNEDKLYYEITTKNKPIVSETMDFFDGSETVTIPYGNLEIYTTRTYELPTRN